VLFSFEHKSQPILAWHLFQRRLLLSLALSGAIIVGSLAGGMIGYHWFEGLDWIDAFTNAAMILSGMGPLAQPQTTVGKIFAGTYALWSGFVVLLVLGITFGPIVHRMLHKLHADDPDLNDDTPQRKPRVAKRRR